MFGVTAGVVRYPTEPAAVAATLTVRCSLAHPSVMIRRAALEAGGLRYDERYLKAQDYDLWCRCVHAGLKLANVPEVLLRYRTNPGQTSGSVHAFQHDLGDRIRSEMLVREGFKPSARELELHSALCRDRFTDTMLAESAGWLNSLWERNERLRVFDGDALGRVLCGRWVRVVRRAREVGAEVAIDGAPLARFVHDGALEAAARSVS
jgi:hypothetical protein